MHRHECDLVIRLDASGPRRVPGTNQVDLEVMFVFHLVAGEGGVNNFPGLR